MRNFATQLNLRKADDTPDLREMIRLYEGGCTLEEIGRLFECSKQNVSRRIRSHTRMRPPGVIAKPEGAGGRI